MTGYKEAIKTGEVKPIGVTITFNDGDVLFLDYVILRWLRVNAENREEFSVVNQHIKNFLADNYVKSI